MSLDFIENLVDKYGKEFLKTILDSVLINKKPLPNDVARALLLKHGIIKKTTKTITAQYYTRTTFNLPEKINTHAVWFENGRGTNIFCFNFTDKDIPHITELLN